MTGDTLADMVGANIIDTRDLIKRIADIGVDLEGLDEASADDAAEAEDLRVELDTLNKLVEDYDGNYFGDSFRDGVILVADYYFEDYAQEFAEDIGAINRDMPWPQSYIDWTAAAAALQQDYTAIDIEGTTYWGRA